MTITLLVLTYNEELHIKRCLNSVKKLVDRIVVVDSYSSDKTVQIATEMGAEIFQNKWPGSQSLQVNWALKKIGIETTWLLRLDADEYLLPALLNEIKYKLPNLSPEFTGIYLKRRVYFMGKWIKRGGYYPIKILRLWKPEAAIMEDKWMDEHIDLKYGQSMSLEHDFVDENLQNLSWWISKHNNYATREAIELLNLEYNFLEGQSIKGQISLKQDLRKRWIKNFFYNDIPLFVRPFIYFNYRYFFRVGFLDGIRGLIWHFLQGFWYRFLVDAKIYEVKRKVKSEGKPIKTILEEYLGHPL